ncbi:heme exporter protein CcmD [Lichenicola sp.]
MTHLPYVAGAYGLTLAVAAVLSVSAALRLRRARRRLAAVDVRRRPDPAP